MRDVIFDNDEKNEENLPLIENTQRVKKRKFSLFKGLLLFTCGFTLAGAVFIIGLYWFSILLL